MRQKHVWTALLGMTAGSLVFLPGTGYAAEETATFELTESTETWTVPEGVCEVQVAAFGAQGGDSYPPADFDLGGAGGNISGDDAAGAGGGGGSSAGPEDTEFSDAVRSGDGEVTLTYDPESDAGCEQPDPDPGPDPKPVVNGELPATGIGLTPAVWLAGVSAMLGAVLLLAARHWRSRRPTN